MRTLKIAIFATLCLALLITWQRSAYAAEFCSDTYYVNVTLPNQARWDMCWEHRTREGIVLSKIHYTPRNGVRRLVLNQAGLAQIHVPYDDNGARYHDISDYGLGGNYMATLNQTDCPGGKLLSFNNKPVLCQQNEARGSAFTTGTERLKGNSFSLFSVSKSALITTFRSGVLWMMVRLNPASALLALYSVMVIAMQNSKAG